MSKNYVVVRVFFFLKNMAMLQPPSPAANNAEQDTLSRLNQEPQEPKGPKIMKRPVGKKLTDEEQLIQYFCSCPKLREKIVLSNFFMSSY